MLLYSVLNITYVLMFILDEFLKDQLHQYNVGKRHLANMMGEDPDTFTQEDIDVCILYVTVLVHYIKILLID